MSKASHMLERLLLLVRKLQSEVVLCCLGVQRWLMVVILLGCNCPHPTVSTVSTVPFSNLSKRHCKLVMAINPQLLNTPRQSRKVHTCRRGVGSVFGAEVAVDEQKR